MSRKKCTLVLLCTFAFACFLYLRVAVSTSRQDDVAASAAGTAPFNRLGEETTYYREEKVAPNQGFILVDTYGGQQGSGVESLVSLQVIARFQY